MDCRLCRAEMANGWVTVRSLVPLSLSESALQWEPAELRTTKRRWRHFGKDGAVTLLAGRFLRRRERASDLGEGHHQPHRQDCPRTPDRRVVSRQVVGECSRQSGQLRW
jgi:hypothetical protein